MKLILALVASCACSKQPTYDSNFASVRLTDRGIVDAKTNAPWTGKLVARDAEVIAIARGVLPRSILEHVADDIDVPGLILVLPVDNGAASGKATVLADLSQTKQSLGGRRGQFAKAVGVTIRVAEATFVGGKLEGDATIYGPVPGSTKTGKVATVPFHDHQIQGTAIEFFPGTDKPMRQVLFAQSVPNGESKLLYANGAKRELGGYQNGKPVGTHESWYPTGQIKSRAVYVDGERTQAQSWYSNGRSTSEPPDGEIDEYYNTGVMRSRTHYVTGVQQGEHQEWYANGKPWVAATYRNGNLFGAYKRWWKNGKPAHAYTYDDNGKLDGDYRQDYDNGAKWVRATYVHGKPRGTIERWYPDGTLGYTLSHDDRGRPHGAYKRWWANGRPRLEATYVAGNFEGAFKNWNEDGTVFEMATYHNGNKVQTTR